MKNILTSVLLISSALTAQWRPLTVNEARAVSSYAPSVTWNQALPTGICRPIYRPTFRQCVPVRPVMTPRFNCAPIYRPVYRPRRTTWGGNVWVNHCGRVGGFLNIGGRWGGISVGF